MLTVFFCNQLFPDVHGQHYSMDCRILSQATEFVCFRGISMLPGSFFSEFSTDQWCLAATVVHVTVDASTKPCKDFSNLVLC